MFCCREEQQPVAGRSGFGKSERSSLTNSPAQCGGKRDVSRLSSAGEDLHNKHKGPYDSISPPSSPCVKAVIEKSNSVSFVLDLNDSLSDDSYLELPTSPKIKHATPLLSRKGVQKSRSSSLDKKEGVTVARSNSLSKCTSAGNFFPRGSPANSRALKTKKVSAEDVGNSLVKVPSQGMIKREHTTSESSAGTESEAVESSMERVSPSGLSWTVPVNGGSSSPGSPKFNSTRNDMSNGRLRHLHQPEEDEYDENLEDTVDGYISGIPPDLTPLVHLMTASSSSPSDSELSRCGSQAGLTSESEEESSLAETSDRVGDSLSPVAEDEWTTTVDAADAGDLVVNCGGSESTDSSDQIIAITKDDKPAVALQGTTNEASSANVQLSQQETSIGN